MIFFVHEKGVVLLETYAREKKMKVIFMLSAVQEERAIGPTGRFRF
jgi:hypothetical protein